MQNQRAKFSIPKDTTYLNCAYMSPLLKSVEKAGLKGMARKRNPSSISAQDFFTDAEILRKEFSKLINAGEPERVVIIPSVSYGMAAVSRNIQLKSGDKIIVASEQFPSNYYPWQRLASDVNAELVAISPPDTLNFRGKVWNERILEAIDSKTRMVAIGHVHWADGTRFDLARIRKRTREVGALLIIDGTQSVGAMPFDLKEIQADALVCGGYKWLMGPYSIGMAYYGKYFDGGKPVEESWLNRYHSEDFTGLVNYQNNYHNGSLRYEVGEHSNFILLPMMIQALKQINAWGPENIQEYCHSISYQALKRLRENNFWIEDEDFRGRHLFGIRIPKSISLDRLREKMNKGKVTASFRGASLRISPNVYNSKGDLEKLVSILLKP